MGEATEIRRGECVLRSERNIHVSCYKCALKISFLFSKLSSDQNTSLSTNLPRKHLVQENVTSSKEITPPDGILKEEMARSSLANEEEWKAVTQRRQKKMAKGENKVRKRVCDDTRAGVFIFPLH